MIKFSGVCFEDKKTYYTTFYFLRYQHFLTALEKINASTKYTKKDFAAGVRMLENFKEYFYITIFKW